MSQSVQSDSSHSQAPNDASFAEQQQRQVADELVRRLKEGDQTALGGLFELYQDRLMRVIDVRLDRRLHSRVDPSDVLQDAYLDASTRLDHFFDKPDASIAVWLRLIVLQRLQLTVRHHLLTEKRDARKEVPMTGQKEDNKSHYGGFVNHLADSITSPSAVVARDEAVGLVEKMLDEMNETDREVLVLRHFEQVPNDEVSEILGISVKAASNRYVRALDRLRILVERMDTPEKPQ